MQITNVLDDDTAATPVIGVLLLVAITLILAGVIGTFVLGLNSGVETAPTTEFDFAYQGSNSATITHGGGDDIPADQLTVVGVSGGWGASGDVTSGDSITVSGFDNGDELRIVWQSESGETTQTLATSTVPS